MQLKRHLLNSYSWFLFFLCLGPCPPCPKMVTTSCHCRKAKPVPRRCSAKEWSCRLPCGRMLLCGQHTCENPCHSGSLPPQASKEQLFYFLRSITIFQVEYKKSNSYAQCNYDFIQEIVSLVHVSVNSGASVEGRQQKGFVQVLSGSVNRYVHEDDFPHLIHIFIKLDYSVYYRLKRHISV